LAVDEHRKLADRPDLLESRVLVRIAEIDEVRVNGVAFSYSAISALWQ
jgi:hypothetical protein